jgi:hypothetical protein
VWIPIEKFTSELAESWRSLSLDARRRRLFFSERKGGGLGKITD